MQKEFEALIRTYEILSDLGEDSRKKVIEFLITKFESQKAAVQTAPTPVKPKRKAAKRKKRTATKATVRAAPAESVTAVVKPKRGRPKSAKTTVAKKTAGRSGRPKSAVKPPAKAAADGNGLKNLLSSVTAKGNAEKVLLAAYHLSTTQKLKQFTARNLNGALKAAGEGIKNITLALAKLEKSKLVTNVQGKSDTKRTRGTYQLTASAKKLVAEALKSGNLAA